MLLFLCCFVGCCCLPQQPKRVFGIGILPPSPELVALRGAVLGGDEILSGDARMRDADSEGCEIWNTRGRVTQLKCCTFLLSLEFYRFDM